MRGPDIALPQLEHVSPAEDRDDDVAGLDVASRLAGEVKALLASGDAATARDRFADLVGAQQRRANRIALAYLRNTADADEAVQDAFVKVFTRLSEYRENLPFEQWFTRILVNACIDRHRARQRRERRLVPLEDMDVRASSAPSPERNLVGRQWSSAVSDAVEDLPDRQRAVFTLCHYAERTPAEVSAILGVREATVRVHLFRAIGKLRVALEGWRNAR